MHYNHENVKLARALRKNMTPWEQKLWHSFLKVYTPRFQRQKPIGSYIADFYCSKGALIVELDGSGHMTQKAREKDRERTAYFESLGIYVLRFYNTDIDKNFNGVCEVIDQELKKRI